MPREGGLVGIRTMTTAVTVDLQLLQETLGGASDEACALADEKGEVSLLEGTFRRFPRPGALIEANDRPIGSQFPTSKEESNYARCRQQIKKRHPGMTDEERRKACEHHLEG